MSTELPSWWRVALLAVIVAALWGIGWATGLHELVTVAEIRSGVAEAGMWGFLLFIVVFCVGQLAQVGGHPFIAAAVLIWGWGPGALVSIVAGSLGTILNFAFSRAVGGDVRAMNNKWLERVLVHLDDAPIRTMFVARILFMTAPLLASVLALSGVRHRDHALATTLGLMFSVPVASYAWSVGLDWLL